MEAPTMPRPVILLIAIWLGAASTRGQSPILDPPIYTAASIANTAASVAGLYAPDTFVTIYGQNLSYVTRAISADDIGAGILPTALIGTGVRVLINSIAADIYYVSPGQVNLLIPTLLTQGPAILQLVVDGIAGPAIPIILGASAPALFQLDAINVLATHADYSLVTPGAPAQAGEEIVLYATGLGATIPAAVPNQIPDAAAVLADMIDFEVMLNGTPVNALNIAYAGVVPGYAGLFQINLVVPAGVASNPEVRVGSSALLSPAGRYLPLQ
jgi:uncharacterized protein (TIGR03437 family)